MKNILIVCFLSSLLMFSCKTSKNISDSMVKSTVDLPLTFYPVYHNLNVLDLEAKRGLDMILGGRSFRPHGVPMKLLEKMYLVRGVAGYGDFALTADGGQLSVFGKLPSPSDRTVGLGKNQEDYTLGFSAIDIGRCYDKNTGEPTLAVLPLDEFSNLNNCDKNNSLESTQGEVEKSHIWHHNCFTCHAGAVGRHIIAGSHSNYNDQFAFAREVGLLSKFFDPLAETEIAKIMPEFRRIGIEVVRDYVVGLNDLDSSILESYLNYSVNELTPTLKWSVSVGDNIGPFLSYKGMGLLDPNSDGYKIFDRKEMSECLSESDGYCYNDKKVFQNNALRLPSVDANPWWLLKFKKYIFWVGDTLTTNANQFIYAFTFQHEGTGVAPEGHIKRLAMTLRYSQKIHSPKWPGCWSTQLDCSINYEKVEEGRKIFHEKDLDTSGTVKISGNSAIPISSATCSSCHGYYKHLTPGTDSWRVDYPGSIEGPIDVGTDPEYSKVSAHVTNGIQPILNEVANKKAVKKGEVYANKYKPKVSLANSRGVMPPPLVGLWASPPYLHNGSVPTVFEVLRHSARPDIWLRPSLQAGKFDEKNLGFKYGVPTETSAFTIANKRQVANDESFTSNEAVRLRKTYLSKDYGHGNHGHEWGDSLSDEEIYAIIEFLKSVSGPDVLPQNENQGVDFGKGILD